MLRTTLVMVAVFVGWSAPGRAEPPQFGWIAGEWSPRALLKDITWRATSQEFYCTSQHVRPPRYMSFHKLDPADPESTLEEVPWRMVHLSRDTLDIPWGIVWDSDSNCFWISQSGSSIYGGSWLARYVWDDSSWVWAGTPADTWKVGDSLNRGAFSCLWVAGLARNPLSGLFYCAPVHYETHETLNFIAVFDPYTKTYLGRMENGADRSERGVELVPWDSSYLLTCGWNNDRLYKRDSTGAVLDEVPYSDPACWALQVPELRHPDSTVWLYMTKFPGMPNFIKVSTGMTWGQLGMVGMRGRPEPRFHAMPDATFVRGAVELPGKQKAELVDGMGRRVMGLRPGENDVGHLAAGVYFVRLKDGDAERTARVVLTE